MIEVNLMPRKVTRSSGAARSAADTFPSKAASPWHIAACVPGLAGLLGLALLHAGTLDQKQLVEARLAQALGDSTELAELISASERLRAGRDSVATRIGIIQELDRGRYVWPHILDEVAVAVPDHAWLTRVAQRGEADGIHVEIEGRAGNTFALTRFMSRLEASPLLTAASLVTTEQIAEGLAGGGEWILNSFVLQVRYQPGPDSPDEEQLPDDIDEDAGPLETQP